MASARAAPRTSSRSRQTFPVSERATPRNAGGGSMGKAEAGSVMMLSVGWRMRNGAESPESQHPPDDGNGGGRHTHFSHFSLDKTGKSSISGKAGPKIRS